LARLPGPGVWSSVRNTLIRRRWASTTGMAGRSGPQFAADRQAVLLRQHEVADDHVGQVLGRPRDRLDRVQRLDDLVNPRPNCVRRNPSMVRLIIHTNTRFWLRPGRTVRTEFPQSPSRFPISPHASCSGRPHSAFAAASSGRGIGPGRQLARPQRRLPGRSRLPSGGADGPRGVDGSLSCHGPIRSPR